MRFRLFRHAPLQAVFAGAAVLALAAPPAPAQQVTSQTVSTPRPGCCPTLGCPTPLPGGAGDTSAVPSPFDGTTATPGGLSLAGGLSAAVGGETVALDAAGYIDDAIPRTQVRLRFDAAYDNNRPDRAEFFYGKCGCFRLAGLDPRAPGPPKVETSVDYQEIATYLEYAATDRISGFIELPWRFINPEQNRNFNGFGDMNLGAKVALISNEDTVLTFQGRIYTPTGDAFKGLGTHHTTLEPAILLYQRLGDRLAAQAELRDWIPTDGTDFVGNVLRYGVGFTYLALERPKFRVLPSAELVGWTVFSGKELAVASPTNFTTQKAWGDSILNAKFGVRIGFGSLEERGLLSQSDLYIGYGRALTGDVWYKDILRVEYRMRF